MSDRQKAVGKSGGTQKPPKSAPAKASRTAARVDQKATRAAPKLSIDLSKVDLNDDLYGSDITPIKLNAWTTNDSDNGLLPASTTTGTATDFSATSKQDDVNIGAVESLIAALPDDGKYASSAATVSADIPTLSDSSLNSATVPGTVSDHPVDSLKVTLAVAMAAGKLNHGLQKNNSVRCTFIVLKYHSYNR